MPMAVGHPEITNTWRTDKDEWGRIFKDGMNIDGKVKQLDDIKK